MRRGASVVGLLAALALVAACAGRKPVADLPVPVDAPHRIVAEAHARTEAGALAAARLLFEEVVERFEDSPVHDQALYGLARTFVLAPGESRDYGRAHRYFARLAREHPASPYAADARAWRDLLAAYLARTREVEHKERDLEVATDSLDRQRRELERTKQELERRGQELERRGQELERRGRELERTKQELERRTRDLERLREIDVELERHRRP